MKPTYDYLWKILLVGDNGVGKTQLFNRFADNTYHSDVDANNRIEFKIRTINENGKTIKLQIWDTCTERTKRAGGRYWEGAHGIIVTFDITNQKSFNNAQNWLKEIERWAHEDVQILLVGTKSDLTSERAVLHETAKELADINEIEYIETSAKDATNVKQAFLTLAQKIRNKLVPDPSTEDVEEKLPNSSKTSNTSRKSTSSEKWSSATMVLLLFIAILGISYWQTTFPEMILYDQTVVGIVVDNVYWDKTDLIGLDLDNLMVCLGPHKELYIVREVGKTLLLDKICGLSDLFTVVESHFDTSAQIIHIERCWELK